MTTLGNGMRNRNVKLEHVKEHANGPARTTIESPWDPVMEKRLATIDELSKRRREAEIEADRVYAAELAAIRAKELLIADEKAEIHRQEMAGAELARAERRLREPGLYF